MTNAEQDRRIDYIEFSVKSVADAKRFYGGAFGWTFEDYGPDYTSFADGRLSGGFQSVPQVKSGGPLVVIYAADLEAIFEDGQRKAKAIDRNTWEAQRALPDRMRGFVTQFWEGLL